MLTRRRVLVAKIETTEGTGETLAVADGGILVINPKVAVGIGMSPRELVESGLSPYADLPGAQSGKISFRAELIGQGTAYSASNVPVIGKYLRACGFSETVDATVGVEKVTYKPVSSGHPSLTIGCYEDGVIKRIIGARGNVKFSGGKGQPVYADFEFSGAYDGVTDGAMLAPTFEDTLPPVLLSANFSVGAYAALINGFDIDMGNKLALRPSINTASGHYSAAITGRRPTGKIDPEMTLVATHDWYGRWKAGTLGALTIGDLGSVQYKKVKLTAPKLQYTGVADADRDGIAIADTSFLLSRNLGDDELEILFS